MKNIRKHIVFFGSATILFIAACNSTAKQNNTTDVPTTIEHHSSSISNSISGKKATSSSRSSSSGDQGYSYSYSYSTNAKDVKNSRTFENSSAQMKKNDSISKEINVGIVGLLLKDKIILKKDQKVKMVINEEYVIVNKRILNNQESQKYIQLIKDKLDFENSFTYNFNQK